MALLQISEPGMSTAPHEHRLAVGIDLGTTNSLVASVRSGAAEILCDPEGNALLPSVVRYLENGATEVGKKAQDNQLEDLPNTISSAKRLLGRGIKDLKTLGGSLPYEFATASSSSHGTESNVPQIKTVAGNKTAIEVSAEILKTLKQRAEESLGGELKGAVITVPAYFDDAQRQATKDAARLADLKVFRLLNEPTAAAVAYGLDQKEELSERIIAVYDLGGGTFDISILKLNKGVFEVMATGGDSALGGDDFDHAIAEWILEEALLEDTHNTKIHRKAMIEARRVKEALTDNNEVSVKLEDWQGSLSRNQFDEMVAPLVKKTLMACRRALRDSSLDKDQVHDVVMVGGSTRMPVVREKVGEFFGQPPLVDIDPDKVVAIGAALQADVLAGNKPDAEMLLLDVIPLSLGLETYGGLVEKVIARNTTIPITRAQEFTTFKDNQTAMTVHILQGERETVEENRSLAKFALKGIPPMVAGAARIKVTFQVDADGLLNVHAEEETTGAKAGVEVKPSYGLTDSEIEGMIRDSMDNAQADMEARKLREQLVEADRTLEALDSAMASDADRMLNDEEKKTLLAARSELMEAKHTSKDAESVKAAIKNMEKVAEFYVARRMDDNVKKAMAGHNVDEFNK
ncbi:Fe-S protein assembly chaperone HscA [Cocleimonas flava]|uniref:Chaperone protein HscA homolog n=1 Tax=Cocleimonas flava TaxID=634765 RepID=A0A4R1ESI0_9GAMM|nr:Fe-S protein assembly chaperone HscA [Cocleimonas flava]TCJ82639.1 chaperone protein HscA [Cocleimonas flava]